MVFGRSVPTAARGFDHNGLSRLQIETIDFRRKLFLTTLPGIQHESTRFAGLAALLPPRHMEKSIGVTEESGGGADRCDRSTYSVSTVKLPFSPTAVDE